MASNARLREQLLGMGVDHQHAERCSELFDTATEVRVSRASRTPSPRLHSGAQTATRSAPRTAQALRFLGHEPQSGPGTITLQPFRR